MLTRLCLCLLLALVAPAAVRTAVAADGPPAGFVMRDTHMWDMTSKDGQVFSIYVSLPAGDPPSEGFPVLYVLDGNAMFAGFADARRVHAYGSGDPGKVLIVGIGHPGGAVYDGRRLYDFTAPLRTRALQDQFKALPSGGRDKFSAFLLGELREEIARRYKVNAARQSLFGHSLGGLFALHILYTRPEAFHAIIAASPSVWWDSQAILAEEAEFAMRLKRSDRPMRISRLQIFAGANEEAVIVTDARHLAGRLEALSGFGARVGLEILDDEIHLSVPARSITKALRFAVQWP